MKTLALAASASLLVTAAASADVFVGPGVGFTDNATVTSDIIVGPSFSISDVNVSLNIVHTWVGDLQVTLTHVPTNTSATIFNRPGFAGTGFGSSGDLNGVYNFDGQSANNFWTASAAASGTVVVAPGTYQPHTGGAAGNSSNTLGVFNGLNSAGTWRLSIADHATGDTGSLIGWQLELVPAPGALALLGLAGLVGNRRRRG